MGKLLIIYICDVCQEIIELLKVYFVFGMQGVLYCFIEDFVMVEVVIEFGFYIFLLGIVIFKFVVELQEVVKVIFFEWMFIEIDFLWLVLVLYCGKLNQFGYVVEVVEFIVNLWGILIKVLVEVMMVNFYCLFLLVILIEKVVSV